MKKFLLVMLAGILTFSLAACGSSDDTDDNAEGGNEGGDTTEYRLNIGTGGNSGTYYPLGVATQKIFSELDMVKSVSALTSDASVANVNGIKDGDYELAFIQNDITYYAANGEEMFADNAVEGLHGFGVLYPEVIQLVTTEDSGINSLEDLKGKKVSVGKAASGVEANARQVLDAAGISEDDIQIEYLSFGDASAQLKDNNIDAAFVTAGTPTASIQELKATKGVKVIALPDDVRNTLKEKYPFYVDYTLEKEAYDLEADVNTVAVSAMIVISADVSEDLAYELAKAFYENTDELAGAHERGKMISIDTALEGMPVDVHPGVQKYFDEQK
ncbi:TAXI family TRAP transporter solute-binding subunit [Longirhabdus pacifica]|uniref:TAXI family TRAP transporter solute-binding subunit n=1 Tax=Longirhabdus pacifica TaxID=2305227 RepID=UPI001008C782|nr:TAXI family TRAP transporter solute-binding subunit [Longirhabdus pacifica]